MRNHAQITMVAQSKKHARVKCQRILTGQSHKSSNPGPSLHQTQSSAASRKPYTPERQFLWKITATFVT